jgi:hypothetical protein
MILNQFRKNRTKPNSRSLNKYSRNIKSQSGEDGIIEYIFEVIGRKGWCVEFGAWDGEHLSNTWNLINLFGYSAVLIEGNVKRYKVLQNKYQKNSNVITLNKFVEFSSGPNSLDSILSTTSIPIEFDLLSIDIDGNDYYVWDSLVEYMPRCIVIEFNNTVPPDVEFVQDLDPHINQGCSLLALVNLGKKKGYELVAVTRLNAIFVKSEYFKMFGLNDNSIDACWMPPIEAKIFQGYDGTLFTIGFDKPQWVLKNTKINYDSLQIISVDKRNFKDKC